jgi:hypothetical protein
MDNNSSGDLAECKVLPDLVSSGYNVSIPFGSYSYDLVAEKNGEFYRIQVKIATPRCDRADAAQAQIKRSNRNKNKQRQYDEDSFDILAVWAKQFNEVAYKAWNEPVWSFTVRDEPAANGCGNMIDELTIENATKKLK